MMCCRKLSCLLDVVAQKSCRATSICSRTVRPSAVPTRVEDFRPNGGFAKHVAAARMPGSAFEFQPPPLKEGPARRVRRELALVRGPCTRDGCGGPSRFRGSARRKIPAPRGPGRTEGWGR